MRIIEHLHSHHCISWFIVKNKLVSVRGNHLISLVVIKLRNLFFDCKCLRKRSQLAAEHTV